MIEDNTCLREFLNVEEAADNHLFVNKEFALDAQNDIYKYDLWLSSFEYTCDGNILSSSGCWCYLKKECKQIIFCYQIYVCFNSNLSLEKKQF